MWDPEVTSPLKLVGEHRAGRGGNMRVHKHHITSLSYCVGAKGPGQLVRASEFNWLEMLTGELGIWHETENWETWEFGGQHNGYSIQ